MKHFFDIRGGAQRFEQRMKANDVGSNKSVGAAMNRSVDMRFGRKINDHIRSPHKLCHKLRIANVPLDKTVARSRNTIEIPKVPGVCKRIEINNRELGVL